ncbi:WD40-repeat-containing domain protein [Pyronema omphalodes]|nr:WD40-repeat-containing domain protein [Pyronema omphalodes]
MSLNLQSGSNGAGAIQTPRVVPLTCHGHSRPVVHIHFSPMIGDDEYYLISACKDNNPMLRDGMTGDWIGTFLGHKGAVWQARLSNDATLAVTASADFSAKIWDTFSGECLQTLVHNHIVRACTFSPSQTHIATGGHEKKLRIYDLNRTDTPMELGPGVHAGTIKSIVWSDPTTIVSAADDMKLRWWDARSGEIVSEFAVNETFGSCELSPEGNLISATAGKSVYFFDAQSQRLIKNITTSYEVSSVALHQQTRKFVIGSASDTWVRVYNYDTEQELEVHKGHHGPVWSISFTPDGKAYATGSEDGTIKLWKYTDQPYGLWK